MGFKPYGLFSIPVCFFYLRRENVISLLFVSEILAGYFLYFSKFARRFFFFGVLLYGAILELFSFSITAVALRTAPRG